MTPRPFEDRMALTLQAATLAALAAAVAAVVAPDRLGRGFGVAVVTLLVAAPLARVLALVTHWHRARDARFVAVGVGLLALVGAGALLAALR